MRTVSPASLAGGWRLSGHVGNDQQVLQNHWITVLLHHPSKDVVIQTLHLPHIECVPPIDVSIADILVQPDQFLAEEAANAVWRLSNFGVNRVFNVILSRGIVPSDYSPRQVAQAVGLLGKTCPPERRELYDRESQPKG